MTINDVIKKIAKLSGNHKLESYITEQDENPSATTLREYDCIVECINSVTNLIATNYIHIKHKIQLSVSNKFINYIKIPQLFEITKIVDSVGNDVQFEYLEQGVEVSKDGYLTIWYYKFPVRLTNQNSTIYDLSVKVSLDVFSYGVMAEYLFINGNIDDCSLWQSRFDNAMRNIIRPKKELKIKQRRWE